MPRERKTPKLPAPPTEASLRAADRYLSPVEFRPNIKPSRRRPDPKKPIKRLITLRGVAKLIAHEFVVADEHGHLKRTGKPIENPARCTKCGDFRHISDLGIRCLKCDAAIQSFPRDMERGFIRWGATRSW